MEFVFAVIGIIILRALERNDVRTQNKNVQNYGKCYKPSWIDKK